MDGIQLLRKFAKEEGIDPKRVDAFLSKFNNPKTLEELMELPHDLLKHFDYIGDVQDPLYSFIKGFDLNRCEVVDLDRIADNILDNKYYYEQQLEEDECTIEEAKKAKAKLEKYEAIIKQLIDIKFGSLEYDW
jgi:hypothetical protein